VGHVEHVHEVTPLQIVERRQSENGCISVIGVTAAEPPRRSDFATCDYGQTWTVIPR
jgi:hypothetical protein